MAPTICRDEENRCRHTIREVRKENSSFSVINYVGKKSTKLRKTTNNISSSDNSNVVISRKKVELFIRDTCSSSSNNNNNSYSNSNNNSSSDSTTNTQSSLCLSDDNNINNNNSDDINDRISTSDNNNHNNNNSRSNNSDVDMIHEQNSLLDHAANDDDDEDDRPKSNFSSADSYYTDMDMNDNGCCKTEFYTNIKKRNTDVCKKLSSLMNIGYSVKILNKNNNIIKDSSDEKLHNSNNLKRQNYGLLEIAIRTVHLMKRNQILQERLAQLQAETQAFITSVMSNPENKEIREKMEQDQLNK